MLVSKGRVMTDTIVNTEMAAAWNGDEGEEWARDWQRYDRAVRGYHRILLDAAAVGRTDHALDVGCGNGESTRDAARAAVDGTALGVDLSSRMVERARELARARPSPTFVSNKPTRRRTPLTRRATTSRSAGSGRCSSPIRSPRSANIGAGIRPGGRLVMIGWRGVADNEWLRCVFGVRQWVVIFPCRLRAPRVRSDWPIPTQRKPRV